MMLPQDVHDYNDVAENYDLYLDVMYNDEVNHTGFQEFYLDFAKEYGENGVIDIACGTGAVLLHLAEHGIYADGTDLSEAMCRVADKKAKAKGFNLNIFAANMTEFKSDKKYARKYLVYSFLQLYWRLYRTSQGAGHLLIPFFMYLCFSLL